MIRQSAILLLAYASLAQVGPTFSVDVNVVRVPCVVHDAKGAPMTQLSPRDLAVFEDGVPRSIKYLWNEIDLPLTVGLIADVSGSQGVFIERHGQTLLQFLNNIVSERDRALLVSVSIQQRLITNLTNSIDQLRAGVEALSDQDAEMLGEPCSIGSRRVQSWMRSAAIVMPCSSPIWNAVFFTASLKLQHQPGRKALLLLTGGDDMGSQHGLEDAIKACQNAETMVYAIHSFDLMKEFSEDLPARVVEALRSNKRLRRNLERQARETRQTLARLSMETGGRLYSGESADIATILSDIEADLRSQHVIGYAQPNAPKRGYHRITVKVKRPGLAVRARAGYHVQ